MDIESFIDRWANARIGERSEYQSFLIQLCGVLGIDAPNDLRPGDSDYQFERPVKFRHDDGGSHTGFIDCYRRGSFVLEAKRVRDRLVDGSPDPAAVALSPKQERQFSEAKRQAESYARALDEWPPFILVADVGRSIDLYADFTLQGKHYAPFPSYGAHRIHLSDLRDPAVRDRLRAVWNAPLSLDPEAQTIAVTTEIAAGLGRLIRSINARVPVGADGGIDEVDRQAWSKKTTRFVLQCIFAMFADSIGLIDDREFRGFLRSYVGTAEHFHEGAALLFPQMDRGGHFPGFKRNLRRFNGGLFKRISPVPLNEADLAILIDAAGHDWNAVEPAIFGALLEQALNPDDRRKLGAHYTPKPYVATLVEAVIMEPLRAEWSEVQARAAFQRSAGTVQAARDTLWRFHARLCNLRILDPACGTGNFLYVAMEHLSALEAEVVDALIEAGETRAMLRGMAVSPQQFLGFDIDPVSVEIAQTVMWIGYLQRHHGRPGHLPISDPVLRDYETIVCIDAVLASERTEFVRDDAGRPVTAAGDTMQIRHIGPRERDWPAVDFIIGNPPFMGAKDLRSQLGDAYVDALWAIRQGRFRSADFAMIWWDRAAQILSAPGSKLRRFGFITSNSVTQTFSRRVIEHHLNGHPPIRLSFAVPDHPWLKGPGAADVRIAMTAAERGEPDGQGRLLTVIAETATASGAPDILFRERRGDIAADLTIGSGHLQTQDLVANAGIAFRGVQLMGAGFIVEPAHAARLIAASDPDVPSPIRPYRNGRDLADRSRGALAIDLYGLDENEARRRHPAIYQHLLETVKPERDRNKRAGYRDNWWTFGEPRRELRAALAGLSRYIVTVETAKHRWFRFLDAEILPDNRLVCVASDDAAVLGVLSSRFHGLWCRALGGVLEDRPIYTKGTCFDRFPFPLLTPLQRLEIGKLAEEIDARRHEVLARHPHLTMTQIYNARARMASGAPLSAAEHRVHEDGLVGILDLLHGRLDALVAEAYGWPPAMAEADALAALVALNRERAVEEGQGRVRFVRPDYQTGRVRAPHRPLQIEAPLQPPESLPPFPEDIGLASALVVMLRDAGNPLGDDDIVKRFQPPTAVRRKSGRHTIRKALETLVVAGLVQPSPKGWFMPRRAL